MSNQESKEVKNNTIHELKNNINFAIDFLDEVKLKQLNDFMQNLITEQERDSVLECIKNDIWGLKNET